MSPHIDRREFLKASAGATMLAAGAHKLSAEKSGLTKLHHAAVGVGGKGWGDVGEFAEHPDVVVSAICDIDAANLRRAAEKFPKARRYLDWREMLAKEGDKIDSVSVSTADHMHAPIAMSAIALGKHVYCQKPLTHDIYESRQLTQAAAEKKIASQMGIQVTSTIGYRMAVQMIQDGVIGKVKQVYLWSNKPAGNYRPTGPRPEGSDPIPDSVRWDLWLGTAPARPYKEGVYHPKWWRGWRDFGVGWLGDMGCHIFDPPFRALKLTAPISIRAEVEPAWRDTPGRYSETWPTWQILHYTFPGNDLTADKTLKFTWSDGGKYPPDELRKHIDGMNYPDQGSMLIGEEGTMLLPHVGGPQFFPKEKYRGIERPDLEPRNHYHHWIDACLGRVKTAAGFDYAGPLTETVLLGTIGLLRSGLELEWNAGDMLVTNDAKANQYLRREYREGWAVEGL